MYYFFSILELQETKWLLWLKCKLVTLLFSDKISGIWPNLILCRSLSVERAYSLLKEKVHILKHSKHLAQRLSSKRQPPSACSIPKLFWFHNIAWENYLNIVYSCWCSWCCHFRCSKRCCLHILCCWCHCTLPGDGTRGTLSIFTC